MGSRFAGWQACFVHLGVCAAKPRIPLETYSDGAVQTIINSFGVYGVGHLLKVALVWLVIARYRSLIPLVYVFMLASELLGIALLAAKPLPVVPPGQIGVYVLLPLTLGFFLLSVKKPRAAIGAA